MNLAFVASEWFI